MIKVTFRINEQEDRELAEWIEKQREGNGYRDLSANIRRILRANLPAQPAENSSHSSN